jgi:hypothetical protein
MMDARTYVVGMEPANCLPMGRVKEREAGRLQSLAPGEAREYEVEIGVLAGAKEVSDFESLCQNLIAQAK